MVLFNYSTKEITAKIVYYGPGLCGKTTNLQFIYESLPGNISKGKMLSLATKTDRTLFFDFLPIDLGTIRGMRTRLQLYTVPGQVFYNTTRKLVLKGADGVVFVADSQKRMLDANLESFKNLEENLAEHDLKLAEIPIIIQFNKRDLPEVLSVEELNAALNKYNSPIYEAVATTGIGVHETLKASTRLVLNSLKERYADKREQKVNESMKAAAMAAVAARERGPEASPTGAAAPQPAMTQVSAPAVPQPARTEPPVQAHAPQTAVPAPPVEPPPAPSAPPVQAHIPQTAVPASPVEPPPAPDLGPDPLETDFVSGFEEAPEASFADLDLDEAPLDLGSLDEEEGQDVELTPEAPLEASPELPADGAEEPLLLEVVDDDLAADGDDVLELVLDEPQPSEPEALSPIQVMDDEMQLPEPDAQLDVPAWEDPSPVVAETAAEEPISLPTAQTEEPSFEPLDVEAGEEIIEQPVVPDVLQDAPVEPLDEPPSLIAEPEFDLEASEPWVPPADEDPLIENVGDVDETPISVAEGTGEPPLTVSAPVSGHAAHPGPFEEDRSNLELDVEPRIGSRRGDVSDGDRGVGDGRGKP